MQKMLRYGITTGTCAAAAAKAAVLTLLSGPVDRVVVPSPLGLRIEVPVKECKRMSDHTVTASVIKDAGDDADVTDGLEIFAKVSLSEDDKIVIKGGKGIGIVTKPGLPVPLGEPAINTTPRRMIKEAIKEVLPPNKGAEVVISIPESGKVSKKTFNKKLGIIDGISVLGTTGIVKPFSIEAYKSSLVSQIDIAIAKEYKRIILVPGNIGEKLARKLLNVPNDGIVQTGDFIGFMLKKAVEKGLKEIMLFGHPGKLVKVAAGIFNTHHKSGDARKEVIAAYAGASGADTATIQAILQSNTTEEMIGILKQKKLLHVTFNKIAGEISQRSMERIENKAEINTILVALDGTVVGSHGKAEAN
ncbi:MAG: cobalt-precorrin-5B (C(1))-methyltransferase CbiD [Candidatus Methylarchaceae archaeon HK02M2]|nr:cobalt-precorrin-5B (C(1))-methyltransferase CbiD [Candidatus Methylarchaceae archaeon HK02M2]